MLLKDERKKFMPAPAGQHLGVCVDFVDEGIVDDTFQGRPRRVHKCRIVFELDPETSGLMENGKRFIISRRFTASLNEKATLRKFLEDWRSRPFTEAELEGFDTETLIGANALCQVIHKPSAKDPRDIYANIQTIMRAPKAMGWIEPSDGYTRVKDRLDENPPHHGDDEPPPPSDDDLPF